MIIKLLAALPFFDPTFPDRKVHCMPPQPSFSLPDDLPLQIGATGDSYYVLNAILKSRGYLIAPVVTNVFDEASAHALYHLRNHRQLPSGATLGAEAVEVLEKSWCGLPSRIPEHLIGIEREIFHSEAGNPWGTTDLTYKIVKPSSRLDAGAVESAIATAFQWWSKAYEPNEPALTFTPLLQSDSTKAHIDIYFYKALEHVAVPRDGVKFYAVAGEKRALAHAYYPIEELEEDYQGDIHFNDDVEWQIAPLNGPFDLATVAAHEIGHALGLGHNLTDKNSIMYEDYTVPFSDVSDADKAELVRIYKDGGTMHYHAITDPRGGGTNPTETPGGG
jgi:hypothetical protein